MFPVSKQTYHILFMKIDGETVPSHTEYENMYLQMSWREIYIYFFFG